MIVHPPPILYFSLFIIVCLSWRMDCSKKRVGCWGSGLFDAAPVGLTSAVEMVPANTRRSEQQLAGRPIQSESGIGPHSQVVPPEQQFMAAKQRQQNNSFGPPGQLYSSRINRWWPKVSAKSACVRALAGGRFTHETQFLWHPIHEIRWRGCRYVALAVGGGGLPTRCAAAGGGSFLN
jgi:hypothetical protein